MDDTGRLLRAANPWAVQWMNDIQALAVHPDYEGIVERVGGRPLTVVIDERIRDEFLVIDMAFLRAAELTKETATKATHMTSEAFSCPNDGCTFEGFSAKGLRQHLNKCARNPGSSGVMAYTATVTNQCVRCLNDFRRFPPREFI